MHPELAGRHQMYQSCHSDSPSALMFACKSLGSLAPGSANWFVLRPVPQLAFFATVRSQLATTASFGVISLAADSTLGDYMDCSTRASGPSAGGHRSSHCCLAKLCSLEFAPGVAANCRDSTDDT